MCGQSICCVCTRASIVSQLSATKVYEVMCMDTQSCTRVLLHQSSARTSPARALYAIDLRDSKPNGHGPSGPRENVCAEQTSICSELKPPEACPAGVNLISETHIPLYNPMSCRGDAQQRVRDRVDSHSPRDSGLHVGAHPRHFAQLPGAYNTILFTCVLRVSAVSPHLSNVGLYPKTSDPKVSNWTNPALML
jgi:hypothetical protein